MSLFSADLAVVLPAERRDFGKDYRAAEWRSLYEDAFCTLIWEIKTFSRSFPVRASTQLLLSQPALPAPTAKLHCVSSLQNPSCYSIVWMLCICQNFLLCFSFSLSIEEGISQVNSFHPHTRSFLKVWNIFQYTYGSISREGGGKSEVSKVKHDPRNK